MNRRLPFSGEADCARQIADAGKPSCYLRPARRDYHRCDGRRACFRSSQFAWVLQRWV